MLDVHPLHGAIHSWRDLLTHIAVIAIGLLLALGLEQLATFVHHRYQVREARRALLQERVENHTVLAEQTRAWHWWVAELQNNLTVLRYLQQHPGTPQERLPGVLVWRARGLAFSTAVWDAAHQSGVIALMPREEIEESSDLYQMQARVFEQAYAAGMATVEASSYQLLDADPSHLTSAQVSDEIHLVQVALLRVSLLGRQLLNLSAEFHDFPPSVSEAQWLQLNNAPDAQTRQRLAPARAITDERLRAAGYAPLKDTPK